MDFNPAFFLGFYSCLGGDPLCRNAGVMVMVRNKEMNLYHTTVEEDTCVCYNCSLFAGEGLWMKFEPLFDRFLSTLHFRDHKGTVQCLLVSGVEVLRRRGSFP